ncbi:MAG TPA: hypothetical protein VGE64_13245 [Xanthomonadaceae bacterium]
MKQSSVLTGIAARLAAGDPCEKQPLRLTVDVDGAELSDRFRSWLCEEYPFLCSGKDELDVSEVALFDSLFFWLCNQFRQFPNGEKAPDQHLTRLLVLASMLEDDAQLWGELEKVVSDVPPALLETLAFVINQNRTDAQRILRRHVLADQVQLVLANIASKNWISVESLMPRLWRDIWSPVKHHAAAALHRFDRPRLASILDEEDDFFEIAAYVLHAPTAHSLQIATASSNWTFKFWALHQSVSNVAEGAECYPEEWRILLSQAVNVPDEWQRWLAVINQYPSRYPQLQETLGWVLTDASDVALDAYVSSLSLSPDHGRSAVRTALKVFRERASISQRKYLWTAAFSRWQQWDFGTADGSRSVFRVTSSNLDFPVLGYLIECCDSQSRAQMTAKLQVRAICAERNWHADVTSAISERFKLISIYQLLAQAEQVASGEQEWLWDGLLHRPTWEDGSLYRNLKYDALFERPVFATT